MAELKTLIVHSQALALGAGLTEEKTEEVIAEENMHIIGAFISWACFTAMNCSLTVAKTGTYKVMGAYAEDKKLDPTDFPMFFHTVRAEPTALPIMDCYAWEMLGDAGFYLIKKDDRFYVHVKHGNDHATSSYNSSVTIVFLYY